MYVTEVAQFSIWLDAGITLKSGMVRSIRTGLNQIATFQLAVENMIYRLNLYELKKDYVL